MISLTDTDKAQTTEVPPAEWIDGATGHRVIRLSREPGSASLYFHQNAYSADGKKLVITTPSGLSAINLKTHEIEPVVDGKVNVLVTGRKSGDVYYTRGDTVCATNLQTHAARQVITLPHGHSVSTLNADETLLAGTIDAIDPTGKTLRPQPRTLLPQRERMFPGKAQLTSEEEAAANKEDRLLFIRLSFGICSV